MKLSIFTRQIFHLQCLFFFWLFLIPEIVITSNQILACVAYKSVAYKRHVMLFYGLLKMNKQLRLMRFF